MSDVWNQSWFWPVVVVAVGLPVTLVVATEVTRALERRGNRAASIVKLIRNFALPLGALLLLLTQVDNLALEVNWSRIVATVFGFVLILVVINLLNFALFATAERGSWRQRIPSIFIDIVKLVVIVVCFALLFQWVWNADVGGLFTALGVTSIVIGLALQNAAGSVVSGLLLLFEQPFRLGDWLDTGSVRGRVVEVNWRAVHIDTGNGTHIVPTASLAGSSFTNLSRVTDFYEAQTTLTFAKTDAPSDVEALIRSTAADLPLRLPESLIDVTPAGAGSYRVSIAVARPADEGPTIALLVGWLWFAARRAGLHLDGEATDGAVTAERSESAVRRVEQRLGLSEDDAASLRASGRLERFGAGEALTHAGEIASGLRFIIDGNVALTAHVEGRRIDYHSLSAPEAVGLGVYTQLPEADTARATTSVTTLTIPRDVVRDLIGRYARLAVELGQVTDHRRQLLSVARDRAATAVGVTS
ncbi:MAG: mechanosensitive ion channel [Candidatus Microbacterium phytovorans]|uniref:Mechanosensitive ion channel n=1 Tax=Candidatus Microbacterium phytovorans TaxID=3121374 RepID=A0AAJ6B3B7_9MICO|nr:mechanosensitive ion channel domain-containing protein [Microbacterium sp.]WEK12967.1 MAG: mechanosensitive ion channel [Microbacterium sp.]